VEHFCNTLEDSFSEVSKPSFSIKEQRIIVLQEISKFTTCITPWRSSAPQLGAITGARWHSFLFVFQSDRRIDSLIVYKMYALSHRSKLNTFALIDKLFDKVSNKPNMVSNISKYVIICQILYFVFIFFICHNLPNICQQWKIQKSENLDISANFNVILVKMAPNLQKSAKNAARFCEIKGYVFKQLPFY